MPNYNLQSLFEESLSHESNLDGDLIESINQVVAFAERQKGVLTVVTTGLVYKYYHPNQDVRIHQSKLANGYSGRTFDTKHVTPFLRHNNFPHMAESGWLTRSLEQSALYDQNYPGAISGKGLKNSFLHIYSATQNQNILDILSVLFKGLVQLRDATQIQLATPANLTVAQTLQLMKDHFSYNYTNVTGAARLPNLAIYAAYRSIIQVSQGRYEEKTLCDLDSHTASDKSTGSIGDIQINTEDNKPYEGLEIKAKKLAPDMVDIAYAKIREHSSVERYYILSTEEDLSDEESQQIEQKVSSIRSKHGCEVIINGVFSTLKYFLRLTDSKSFLQNYVDRIETDDALKYEHKEAWNILCSRL